MTNKLASLRTSPALGLGLSVAGALFAGSAAADAFTFDGKSILLSPPEGYCALDVRRPAEKALIVEQQQLQASYSQVVIAYADCSDLAEFRDGTRDRMLNMGALGVVKTHEQIVVAHEYSRAEFLDGVSKGTPAMDPKAIQQELNERINGTGGDATSDMQSFGLLKRDNLAAYIGGVGWVRHGTAAGPPKMTVNAVTLINSLPISTTITRPEDANNGLTDLLATQRENVASLIRENAVTQADAPTTQDPSAPTSDWQRIAVAGLIATLLGGLLALGRWFMRRRRK